MTISGESCRKKPRSKPPLLATWAPEAPLRLAIVRAIKKRWPRAWVYHPSDRWRTGVPDLLVCAEGRFLAIEVKTARGTVAPIQEATLTAIRCAGGIGWVIRSVKELDHVYLP